jgi:primosomal protein N' (replication factor Y)
MDVKRVRTLRKAMTGAEKRLWWVLRGRQLEGWKFRRQHPIGPYVADFACVEARLIIEADGGQHAKSNSDMVRTAWLGRQGWRVIRFWNNDILANTDAILGEILNALHGGQSPLT